MTMLTIELPEDIVAQAKADTGKRTARAAVLAALKAHHGERMAEPMTPEQCAARMRQVQAKVRITPEMRELGVTKEFFRR